MSEKSSEQIWKEQRKIATLPNIKPNPELVIARTLEKAKRMKGVVILIHWDDGTWDEDHSSMTLSDLIWLERMFSVAIDSEIKS